jgi:hypothetical protein
MVFDARPLGTKARNNRSTHRGLYKPLQKCYSMQSVPWTGSAERNLWEEALTQIKVSVERDLFFMLVKISSLPQSRSVLKERMKARGLAFFHARRSMVTAIENFSH